MIKKIFLIVSVICVIIFGAWSKSIIITICLLVIVDTLSINFLLKYFNIERYEKFYKLLKYIYFITLPLFLAIFIRTFFFDVYYVPSSSMEHTLFPGDYVLVNKIRYGTKVPKRLQDIPVVGDIFNTKNTKHEYDLYRALKGFKTLQREDIVVFKSVEDNNRFLIKRLIGLPGDTLNIKNTHVVINNMSLPERSEYSYQYRDSSTSFVLSKIYANKVFDTLDFKRKKKLSKLNQTKPSLRTYNIFPFTKQEQWTRDNYGPIIIPKKGMHIIFTKENIAIYKALIANYEQEIIQLNDDNDSINYTFKHNYYFMLGDNRHNSIDSRSYGFVPEVYIQGKMILKF